VELYVDYKLQYKLYCLEGKSHQSYPVFTRVLCPGQIGIWSVGFCGGRKTEEPGEKTLGARREK